MIQDSGERRKFDTGAVRDVAYDKGAPHLLPLSVMGAWLDDTMLVFMDDVNNSLDRGDWSEAVRGIGLVQRKFRATAYKDRTEFVVELSKHYLEGCRKYSKDNWKKGIPWESYIDSSIRHYVKWLDGYDDEDHARAFLWNLSALEWSIINGIYKDQGDEEDDREIL